MPNNLLVTGSPGVGKSTALERAVDRLRKMGRSVGGLRSPELREGGERVGFELVDVGSGKRWRLAHVDEPGPPRVGRYGVAVGNVDAAAGEALPGARESEDVIVVDEIAPMEVASDVFVREVRACLDAPTPVLAAVKQASSGGFADEAKQRGDARVVEVTRANRDEMPAELADRVSSWLGG